MVDPKHIFGDFAPLYRTAGFWPRPVRLGSKACPIKKWNLPDPEWKLGELDDWLEQFGHCGIGLVLGSPFSDGTKLAAVDIDRDDYVRVTQALLRNPVCGRIGAKGIAYLVRLRGDGKYRALKVKGEGGAKIGEILCDNRFLVLPHSIHPDTNKPYRWVGRPLLEVDYRELPTIEA
ncbi:bifunctional DNA primase/polymerase [Mesorhizobium qingshengii]|uniref:Bifunctional DNA primase/polymerase, N-terminal n=1 Tax=Mesorhizobium qingshengii TaxID=1165689 RepID=A0A1G5W188_9HYPH|nr:bifunctional DNA primase/polymerase [Mesorhizobium qingshengii]SDA51788.1 Bifunctional DNA primase/polymerase, N-terminal [Mesorhizobium qingshengii]